MPPQDEAGSGLTGPMRALLPAPWLENEEKSHNSPSAWRPCCGMTHGCRGALWDFFRYTEEIPQHDRAGAQIRQKMLNTWLQEHEAWGISRELAVRADVPRM